MTLIADLKRHEGFRSHPYKDSLGYLTIGYGTNLDLGITEDEATVLLMMRAMKVKDELEGLACWDKLSTNRQDVLINMAYNLGVPRLLTFRRMFAALDDRDYNQAAHEMLDSRWRWQVGDRAMELANLMRIG